jgi:hypothetical protein
MRGRRPHRVLFAFLVVVGSLALPAGAAAQVRAGAAAVDASWHVGASAGQYASDGTFGIDPSHGTYDPTIHAYRRAPSYGIQSRLSVRALVIQGPGGNRHAILKNDSYIPQDLVYRRTAQLLEEQGECGITAETLTMAVTHNHSSPMYQSSSWGVWAFQDVFDVRFFDYLARRMFRAVEDACAELVPVRVGASVGTFDKTHRHSFGPALADDGTPAGYPHDETDHDLTVIRFDDVSDPEDPKPLANLVNFSLHPEFLEGNDLISADYVGPLERMADRQTGALTIWTQGAVGTAEPERSTYHSIHERLEFSHRDYAQAEYGARLMTDALVDVWGDIGAGTPDDADRFVPFDSDFTVQSRDAWYPGPLSHPYPGVSNCRTDSGLAGDPLLPIVGLPDCQGVASGLGSLSDLLGIDAPDLPVPQIDPGLSTDDFQALGIPVPENYSAPSYTGLQEDIDVHLQGIRLGEIYLPVCSCEQWLDQSKNIETRTDRVAGNEWLGYDWGARCTDADGGADGPWLCPNPGNPSETLPPVSHAHYLRMRAQVNNPANGWNNLENVLSAESEPTNPAQIKGNYTHDDDAASAALGYRLTVPIAMANDYNGYIATYREYQRGDHYRKALTGWGPHSSDYMASRLVHIGRRFKNPSLPPPADMATEALLQPKVDADLAVNEARARALGETGSAAIAAYEAALPDDGGAPGPVEQPADTERFGAALFTWNGGSNFTDNPRVRVERRVAGAWTPYADQSGELPVTLEYPQGTDVASYLTGGQEWHWTAHFEAFVSGFDLGDRPRATPEGTYRFVVDGERRQGGAVVSYRVVSEEFDVSPWDGITVDDLELNGGGMVSFRAGPRSTYTVSDDGSGVDVQGSGPEIEAEIGPIDYPDSYESPARFISARRTAYRDPAAPGDPERLEWFCFACSFRPWLDAGDAARGEVRFLDTRDGSITFAPALRQGERWVTERAIRAGEIATVETGAVSDEWGNVNGAPAGPLYGPGLPKPPVAEPCSARIVGTTLGERLAGTAASELLAGLGGADTLLGRGGADCVFGGPGRDTMRGGRGVDYLEGGRGHDRIGAGRGRDLVISARGQNDVVNCGRGRDRALVGPADQVRGCEHVTVGPPAPRS